MTAQEVLEGLRDMLRMKLPGLKSAEVWDGAWDAEKGPRRASLQCPAALVSLTSLAVTHKGQQADHPKQLAAARTLRRVRLAHGGGHQPLPAETPPLPTPQARLDVAVTFVSSAPKAPARATEVLALAEAATPILVWAALDEIRGTNLYSPALYKQGMSAFSLFGRRTIEIVPEQLGPQLPSFVVGLNRVGTSLIVGEGPPADDLGENGWLYLDRHAFDAPRRARSVAGVAQGRGADARRDARGQVAPVAETQRLQEGVTGHG